MSKNTAQATGNMPPLYPVEAYGTGSQNEAQNNGQNTQNGLIPLLLSLFGQNNSSADLGKLLAQTAGGNSNDLGSLISLISTLSKKKEDEKTEQKKEEPPVVLDGTLPTNELL